MSNHTEGKLSVHGERIDSFHAQDGEFVVANCYGQDAQENARRLVACWNACDGISTEDLDDALSITDRPFFNQIAAASLFLKGRNELLAALREAAGYVEDLEPSLRMEEILAKYPEES